MDNGSGVGKFLVFCVVIGGVLGYWFYESSHFSAGNVLKLAQTSFMPVSCSIASDRASDVRESANVYFLQGNVRIDLTMKDDSTVIAHQIIKAKGTTYTWRDGSGYGELSTSDNATKILSGIASENSWFCMPWLIPDFNTFAIPGNITFE